MTIFDVIVKQQKSRFCLQFFLLKSSLQTQKSTFTAKFSPISSLEVIFFALILCWGRATASHSLVVANSKICRGRSRNSSVVESQGYFILEWPFLQFHEQGAKFANEVDHLTRFFEKVDSQLPSRLMMLTVSGSLLKMKNGCELTLNRRYSTPYLSLYCNSTKQNDNVTMMFPVNSTLQCFRTAALSMATLNMES